MPERAAATHIAGRVSIDTRTGRARCERCGLHVEGDMAALLAFSAAHTGCPGPVAPVVVR